VKGLEQRTVLLSLRTEEGLGDKKEKRPNQNGTAGAQKSNHATEIPQEHREEHNLRKNSNESIRG